MTNPLQRNNAYLARQEIDKILENISSIDPKRLEPFGYKVYSQGDEDGIIDEIFNRLEIYRGTFAEIGVENGLECNTLFLLHQKWKGWWIEGNETHANFIKNKFSPIIKTGSLKTKFQRVTKENINHIFNDLGIKELDFLSIDIDGMDIHLVDAMEIRPKVLCVEYNAKWPPLVVKKPVYNRNYSWAGGDYMGSSLSALTTSARNIGYELVSTGITGANAFYVRKDLWWDIFPSPSIENLYNPPRYWLIFDHFQHIGHPADFGEYMDLML